jgi:hypothetical protein
VSNWVEVLFAVIGGVCAILAFRAWRSGKAPNLMNMRAGSEAAFDIRKTPRPYWLTLGFLVFVAVWAGQDIIRFILARTHS